MVIAIFSNHCQHLANSRCPEQLADMLISTIYACKLALGLHFAPVISSPQITAVVSAHTHTHTHTHAYTHTCELTSDSGSRDVDKKP